MKYKDADLKRLFEPKKFHRTGAKQGMTGIDTETDKHGNTSDLSVILNAIS